MNGRYADHLKPLIPIIGEDDLTFNNLVKWLLAINLYWPKPSTNGVKRSALKDWKVSHSEADRILWQRAIWEVPAPCGFSKKTRYLTDNEFEDLCSKAKDRYVWLWRLIRKYDLDVTEAIDRFEARTESGRVVLRSYVSDRITWWCWKLFGIQASGRSLKLPRQQRSKN